MQQQLSAGTEGSQPRAKEQTGELTQVMSDETIGFRGSQHYIEAMNAGYVLSAKPHIRVRSQVAMAQLASDSSSEREPNQEVGPLPESHR